MRYLSLFSGMEAAALAWHPLGWKTVAGAEIDPNACALLRHRLPGVPNLGSVTDITDEQIAALGPIDVVIGGSPCQDLSVAGKRAGLAGARSSLFHEQLRIFNAARSLCGARWLVWENVPGAFSSNAGRDFAVVVGAMAGLELAVPKDGWGNEGVAVGENGLVEWSVLDAQWFGVAQRRRRVFAVLDTGDWANRPPVLLERDSLRGDSPPRREARTGIAGSTPSGLDGGECARALTACSTATGRLDPNEQTFVAHTLRADGFDASEDGTGRGTPLVPVHAVAHPLRGDFNCAACGEGNAATWWPTCEWCGHDGSHANAGGQVAVAFTTEQTPKFSSDRALTLTKQSPSGGGQPQAVMAGMAVRRLTPTECERLQGAVDSWTLVPNAKGKPMADGPRYKMLGNSFAVPVIRWIGRRIEMATRRPLGGAA